MKINKSDIRNIRNIFIEELGIKRLDFYMHPEWFIEVCKRIYSGYKFNYDKTLSSFKSLKDPVIITCPIHGDIEIIANDFYNGCGCPYCSGKDSALKKLKKFKESIGIYPKGFPKIKEIIKLTDNQRKFLYENYVFNGYLRVSKFNDLKLQYPELYKDLMRGENKSNIKYIAINIINLLDLSIEENPKCIICGKPAKWNELYSCWFPTDCSDCGRKLSIKRMNDHLKEMGVSNSSQLKSVQNTKRKKFLEKIKNRISDDLIFIDDEEKFLNNGMRSIESSGIYHDNLYKVRCKRCGHEYEAFLASRTFRDNLVYYTKCPKCYPRCSGSSLKEKEVVNYIKSIYDGYIIENTRGILKDRKELDIYIPDKNLAIEYNGLAFHCENSVYSPDKIYPSYHLDKTKECEKKGIDLIHIFENEWNDKPDIIKSIINHKLGLNKIVKCDNIREIDEKTEREFLNRTNIFGYKKSEKAIGLYSNNKLIAVGSFIGDELIRFSQEFNYEIENALDYFQFKKASIDRRYFTGKSFKGFNKKEIPPKYKFTNYYKIIDYPKEGFYKIWDCGYLLLEK